MNIVSIIALVLSLAVLPYCIRLGLAYHRFNEQVKEWADDLDTKMRYAIDAAARGILTELDSRIEDNNNTENTEENG